MVILNVHPLHSLRTREHGSIKVPSPLVGQRCDNGGTKFSACTGETPDPAYWIPYDYYMIERDARARRRAHIYSIIATWGNRLRRRIRVHVPRKGAGTVAVQAAFDLSDGMRESGQRRPDDIYARLAIDSAPDIVSDGLLASTDRAQGPT